MGKKGKEARAEERRSSARRRAEEHKGGGGGKRFNLPPGVKFFQLKKGNYRISIVDFVAGKGNPWADEGEPHYERTFFQHREVGPSKDAQICPARTANLPCPIDERIVQLEEDRSSDEKLIGNLRAKERQCFLVYDHDDPKSGLQFWEMSYHLFGKLLDSRIKNCDPSLKDQWERFSDTGKKGSILRLTVEDKTMGGGKPFPEVTAIDFIARSEALPDDVVKQIFCLDDALAIPSYDELKAAFHGVPVDAVTNAGSKDNKKSKKDKKKKKDNGGKEPEPAPDPEPEPAKEKKDKKKKKDKGESAPAPEPEPEPEPAKSDKKSKKKKKNKGSKEENWD